MERAWRFAPTFLLCYDADGLKILFIMRHSGFVRNFESTLRMLCERGHRVHVAFLNEDRHWLVDTTNVAEQLCGEYPLFSRGTAPVRDDAWGVLGRELRGTLDYLRYQAPLYRDAPKLRARAAKDVSAAVLRMTQRGPFGTRPGLAVLAAWYRLLERSIPVSGEIDAFVAEQQPDLLLISPLIEPGSPQREYVRAARARQIRTVLCVGSWDNLTNKGLIHGRFDLVTVWNDHMKKEAVELHGVRADRVAVTGAQQFDHWFTWQPSTSREAFCARVGLDPTQPYLLYLCSSRFVAPDETGFVRQWIRQLRESSSPRLRSAGVLVRPHPQNEEQWSQFDESDLTNCAIYPRAGAIPIDAASKAGYFDSIYHSAAVVGINTTAEIESAIVGRKVYTLLAPEFRDTQEGTLHFHHLVRVGGGLVHVASDVADHFAQLDAALRDDARDDGRCRRFVEAFVRPYGIAVPATPKLVEAIEAAAVRPAVAERSSQTVARLLRPLLKQRAEQVRRDTHLRLEAKAAQLAARREEIKQRRKELKTQARRGWQADSGKADAQRPRDPDEWIRRPIERYRKPKNALAYRPSVDFFALADTVVQNQRTLLGYDRLYVLWQVIHNVQDLPGAVAEIGSYRGGSAYFMATAFKVITGAEAEIHIFDTFEGHPGHRITDNDPFHKPGQFSGTSSDDVTRYLSEFARLKVHKGEVFASLPHLVETTYRLVHIDTDLYQPTADCLEYFDRRLISGGVVVVDDYASTKCPGVLKAVTEYLARTKSFRAWDMRTEQIMLVKR